ncbi:morphogenic membrane protein MmpB [Streptomyces albidus (ex Kaewkla and Franco 2022)]
MLWSDPHDEPPKEMRATLAMLRRLCWLLPVTVVVAAVLVNIR